MRVMVIAAIVVGGLLALGARSAWPGTAAPAKPLQHAQKPPPRLPAAIVPQIVSLCGKRVGEVATDGRLFNHLHYDLTPPILLSRPPATAGGNCQAVHQDLVPDLTALLAAARTALGPSLYAVSCHRNEAYQATLFCGARSRGIPPEQRAEYVAPPGFSEHHTGYAIDFGSVPTACNFRQCFATTRAGRWLLANAPAYGFEMSFPPANSQGVSPEPWHWRWVGRGNSTPESKARQVFAIARSRFPSGSMSRIAGSH